MLCDTPGQITGAAAAVAYGLRVGTTGLIFGAIAIAWLAYLVPHFARRREVESVSATDPTDRFADSMRVVRSGTAPLLNQDLEQIEAFEVSTPATRRAAIRDLRRLEQTAAVRRRRVLVVLLAALSLVVGLCASGLIPWWSAAIPGGLLAAFVVVARLSVQRMRVSLDERYDEVIRGSDERTVFLARKDVAAAVSLAPSEPVAAVAAVGQGGALWDPVPITMPTYVSKPLAPRTVRTIDLSGPAVVPSSRVAPPVTADAPVSDASDLDTAGESATGDEREIASA